MSKYEDFVSYVRNRSKNDNGYSAKMRKALSESTEYQSWDILSSWVDLENDRERKAYGLIGAFAARQVNEDGKLDLGGALNRVFVSKGGQGEIIDSGEAGKLRRVVSCQNSEELISCLRPMLSFLSSNGIELSLGRLLGEILYFDNPSVREDICLRWTKSFFMRQKEETSVPD